MYLAWGVLKNGTLAPLGLDGGSRAYYGSGEKEESR